MATIGPLTAAIHGLVNALGTGAIDWWRNRLQEKSMNRQIAQAGLLAEMPNVDPDRQRELANKAASEFGLKLLSTLTPEGQEKYLVPPINKEQYLVNMLQSLPIEEQQRVATAAIGPTALTSAIAAKGLDVERQGLAAKKEIAEMQNAAAQRGQDIHKQIAEMQNVAAQRGQDIHKQIAEMQNATAQRGHDIHKQIAEMQNAAAQRGQDIHKQIAEMQTQLQQAQLSQADRHFSEKLSIDRKNADTAYTRAIQQGQHDKAIEELTKRSQDLTAAVGFLGKDVESQNRRMMLAKELYDTANKMYDTLQAGAGKMPLDRATAKRVTVMADSLMNYASNLLNQASAPQTGAGAAPKAGAGIASAYEKALGKSRIDALKKAAASGDTEAQNMLNQMSIPWK